MCVITVKIALKIWPNGKWLGKSTCKISEDESSTQGMHAMHFIVQQVEKAQKNPYLKPIPNNIMMAHALKLLDYELQRFPSHEDLNAGTIQEEPPLQEERGVHPPRDDSSRCFSSPSRCTRRPLEHDLVTLSSARMEHKRQKEKASVLLLEKFLPLVCQGVEKEK